MFALILASLVLLLPQFLRRFAPIVLLEPPATQLASITTAVALSGVELYAMYRVVLALLGLTGGGRPALAAFTFAAVSVVPLAFAWSVTLRRILPRPAAPMRCRCW